jgi:hypothetical protein
MHRVDGPATASRLNKKTRLVRVFFCLQDFTGELGRFN